MINPEIHPPKRRRGRPQITPGENLQLFNVKLPRWVIDAIQTNALLQGKKPGTMAREALTHWATLMAWKQPKGGE